MGVKTAEGLLVDEVEAGQVPEKGRLLAAESAQEAGELIELALVGFPFQSVEHGADEVVGRVRRPDGPP